MDCILLSDEGRQPLQLVTLGTNPSSLLSMEVFKVLFPQPDTEWRAVWKPSPIVGRSPARAALPGCGWEVIAVKEVEQGGRGVCNFLHITFFNFSLKHNLCIEKHTNHKYIVPFVQKLNTLMQPAPRSRSKILPALHYSSRDKQFYLFLKCI